MRFQTNTTVPYYAPKWAWQFVNWVHCLGQKEPGEHYALHAAKIAPTTLRQRLFGGRAYAVHNLVDREFDGLRDVLNETVISPSGIAGIHIEPTARFREHYYIALRAGNKYFDLLTIAAKYALDANEPMTKSIMVALSEPQQAGLSHYFNIRPAIKGSLISDTLVVLRKG